MTVNLEQIEQLKNRANISYAEARDLLEKCNNDVVEALIMLEKENKVREFRTDAFETNLWSTSKRVVKTGENLIKQGNGIRFIVKKHETTVVNLPITIVILLTIFMLPFTLGSILLAILTKHKIKFSNQGKEEYELNKTFDKVFHCENP